jgi:hypothetical protein
VCTKVYFKHELQMVESVGELAQMLGGFDKLAVHPGYGGRRGLAKSHCLCSINIERTFKPTDYILSQWEDACDWTARLPDWIVEQRQREADRARYEAAMAEMRASRSPMHGKGMAGE